jgi:hypothetical protein
MERLIPNPHDAAPIVNEIVNALHSFGDSVKLINTALYVQGFMAGVATCATILTAICAFSQKR